MRCFCACLRPGSYPDTHLIYVPHFNNRPSAAAADALADRTEVLGTSNRAPERLRVELSRKLHKITIYRRCGGDVGRRAGTDARFTHASHAVLLAQNPGTLVVGPIRLSV